jgi:hypothetical protein
LRRERVQNPTGRINRAIIWIVPPIVLLLTVAVIVVGRTSTPSPYTLF